MPEGPNRENLSPCETRLAARSAARIEIPKGGGYTALMGAEDPRERVRKVVDRLLGRSSQNALTFGSSQLDTSRPNIHDNKAAFQAELQMVQGTLDHLHQALDAFLGPTDG